MRDHRLYVIIQPERGGLLYCRSEADGTTVCRGPLKVGETCVRYLKAFLKAGRGSIPRDMLARLAGQSNPALVAGDLHRVVRPAHERLGLDPRPTGPRGRKGRGGRNWGGIACLPDGSYCLLAAIRLLNPADPQDLLEIRLLELLARQAV
ncbi:MAG TPA: hypothetical protein VNO81_10430 [Candidatus Nitrosotenuis sp.]|jgi:hypothetical protein|nr:hypothetical protein [Candidatus Nitrosotenuis sp.]